MSGRLCRTTSAGDPGFAMILVIGFMTIVLGIVAVALSVANRSLSSSRAHSRFDQALAVAESGVDQTLGVLKVTEDYANASTATSCGGTTYSLASERRWARCMINSQANNSTVTKTINGDYYAIRPAGVQTVYSLSWVPNFAAAKPKQRLIKTDYIFANYVPKQAILVGGNLDMSGSVAITGATGQPAGVHSNGDITSRSSDVIAGPVTASGTYDGNARVSNDPAGATGGNAAIVPIVDVDPSYSYHALVPTYSGNAQGLTSAGAYTGTWYDLCNDGTAKAPAVLADGTAGTPCSGFVLSPSGSYRGWTFTAATATTPARWRMTQDNSPYLGAYYVYKGDAYIDGNTSNGVSWNASVFAEPDHPADYTNLATCNKFGGNITWNHTDIDDYVPGTVLVAGADLTDTANNNAGAGLFAAADQVHISTSSASLTGSIVASDICKGDPASPDTDQVQGVTLTYDDTGEGAVASVVRTTLWLEYVG